MGDRFDSLSPEFSKLRPVQTKVPGKKAYLGTFATSIFIQACTVLQGILLARLLGPVGRGEFASVILWPNIFAGVGILGFNMVIARYAGRGTSPEGLTKTAVRAALVTSTFTVVTCAITIPFLLPAEKLHLLPATYLFLLFIPFNHLALNLQAIDHGIGNFRWLNATRALLYPIFFSGIIICWLTSSDKVLGVTIALLAANFGVAATRLIARSPALTRSKSHCGVGAKNLLKESAPYVTAGIISMLYTQMDKALLIWLLPSRQIGWYMAAYAAATSINVLNSSIGIVQFSASTQATTGQGFPAIATALRQGGILTIIGAICLTALLPVLLPVVYGDEFLPAIKIAYTLLPGLLLAGFGNIMHEALRGQGKPVSAVISKLFGLATMAVIGISLAAPLGVIGIAFGYVAGELVAFIGLLAVSFHFYEDANIKVLLPTIEDIRSLWSTVCKTSK